MRKQNYRIIDGLQVKLDMERAKFWRLEWFAMSLILAVCFLMIVGEVL